MPRKSLKLRELRAILRRFGVDEDPSRGSGSHTLFHKQIDGQEFTYPVPGERNVKNCYVDGARKKFRLRAKDGISDEIFYGDLTPQQVVQRQFQKAHVKMDGGGWQVMQDNSDGSAVLGRGLSKKEAWSQSAMWILRENS